MESYEFFATQKEIELLFDKIDRDRDGKISYGEFFSEIAPKMGNWRLELYLFIWLSKQEVF